MRVEGWQTGSMSAANDAGGTTCEKELFVDNLLVRIHCIIVVIRWTGLAPWEFELPFPGNLTSTGTTCGYCHLIVSLRSMLYTYMQCHGRSSPSSPPTLTTQTTCETKSGRTSKADSLSLVRVVRMLGQVRHTKIVNLRKTHDWITQLKARVQQRRNTCAPDRT